MMSAHFAYAPDVRSVTHGDRTVLLDLRREKYYSLDGVGTLVWAMLGENADTPSIAARLAEEFDAPAERIAADVDTLLRQLADDWNVIVPVMPLSPPAEPSAFSCALTLLMVAFWLRVAGLRRTLTAADWLGRRARPAAEPSPEFLVGVVRKVATAAAFFPGRALCLEQSIALYLELRRSGVPARLRIGAQPYPFAAHAWVEYGGELVGTSYDQVSKFVPFDRLTERS
jgi:hypothetical protein